MVTILSSSEENGTDYEHYKDALVPKKKRHLSLPAHKELSMLEQEGPPPDVMMAFHDYRDLGPGRSVTSLHRMYLARQSKDPYAPIPTTNLFVLQEWEQKYNWRTLAWEYDAEENSAFTAARKDTLSKVYKGQLTKADKLLDLAMKAAENLNTDRMSPQDVLKFMVEGNKMKREAEEALIRLQDPREQGAEATGDVFDLVRKMGVFQINNNTQNNITIQQEPQDG